MTLALEQAGAAAAEGEVPVGACLLDEDGELLAADHNRNIAASDPSAHAEMLCLRAAAHKKENHRLPGCTLYVTLEPCAMCVGAIMHARLAQVVFGASDPKTGACGGKVNLLSNRGLNHHTEARGGVLAARCGELLQDFFRDRR